MTSTVAIWAGPIFTNVTAPAGIGYYQSTARNPPNCLFGDGYYCEPERFTGGAAAADYDNDGNIDLYVTRLGGTGILYRNVGDGTFENKTTAAGLTQSLMGNGAGWADIDNDGDQDLYVTTLGDTRFYLFVNNGNGTFTEKAVERGAAVTQSFQIFGMSVAFGDYDKDGFVDIHTCDWQNSIDGVKSSTRLLRNRGTGAAGFFTDVSSAAGVAIPLSQTFAFASGLVDLDGDGWQDLAIASDFKTSRLYWGDGDGTFTEGGRAAGVATDENGMGSTFGDYDGDGDIDWFVTAIYDAARTCDHIPCRWGPTGNRLYRNEGTRHFTDQTTSTMTREGGWGWGTAFLDFDNDGDLDLVMTNGVEYPITSLDAPFNSDPIRLWRNEGGGAFTEIAAASGLTDTGSGKGLLTFDYDNDGDLDIFLVNNASAGILYRNDGGNSAGNWLRVRLRGTTSNRDGLGARVTLTRTAGGARQTREIGVGSQFLSQSERTAHFGLGTGTGPVAEVRVHWPMTGCDSVFTDVPINTTLDVVEPGEVAAAPRVAIYPTCAALREGEVISVLGYADTGDSAVLDASLDLTFDPAFFEVVGGDAGFTKFSPSPFALSPAPVTQAPGRVRVALHAQGDTAAAYTGNLFAVKLRSLAPTAATSVGFDPAAYVFTPELAGVAGSAGSYSIETVVTRDFGDFDSSGCTDLGDFLFLLDFWGMVSSIGGEPISLSDFLNLLDNWNTGVDCP